MERLFEEKKTSAARLHAPEPCGHCYARRAKPATLLHVKVPLFRPQRCGLCDRSAGPPDRSGVWKPAIKFDERCSTRNSALVQRATPSYSATVLFPARLVLTGLSSGPSLVAIASDSGTDYSSSSESVTGRLSMMLECLKQPP